MTRRRDKYEIISSLEILTRLVVSLKVGKAKRANRENVFMFFYNYDKYTPKYDLRISETNLINLSSKPRALTFD